MESTNQLKCNHVNEDYLKIYKELLIENIDLKKRVKNMFEKLGLNEQVNKRIKKKELEVKDLYLNWQR